MKVVEEPITYRDRPEGSFSKLNTFKDGFKVLLTIFNLLKDHRPFLFFTLVSVFCLIMGIVIGNPLISSYILSGSTGNVRLAVFTLSLFVLAFLAFVIGIILDAIKNQTRFLFECHLNDLMHQINKEEE